MAESYVSTFVPVLSNINYKLAPGETLQICPYESTHHVRSDRMGYHIPKCRRNYEKVHGPQETRSCRYGHGLKDIPLMELRYHEEFCSNKDEPIKVEGHDKDKVATMPIMNVEMSKAKCEDVGEGNESEYWLPEPGRCNFNPAGLQVAYSVPSGLAPSEKKALRSVRAQLFKDNVLSKQRPEDRDGTSGKTYYETQAPDIDTKKLIEINRIIEWDILDLDYFNDDIQNEELVGEASRSSRKDSYENVEGRAGASVNVAEVEVDDGVSEVAGSCIDADAEEKTEAGCFQEGKESVEMKNKGDVVESEEDDEFFDALSTVSGFSMGPYVPK